MCSCFTAFADSEHPHGKALQRHSKYCDVRRLYLTVPCAGSILQIPDIMSQYAYVSLSLIGLCALAGAGVGVGSGVAMMYSQMAQAEQEQKTTGAVAHSPGSFLGCAVPDAGKNSLNTDVCRLSVQLRGRTWPCHAALLLLVPRASKVMKTLPVLDVGNCKQLSAFV